jgi:hypothetical protein
MRTLNIAISDLEFNTFGLRSSSLSLDEITAEVEELRADRYGYGV